jgi:hypothetical protein
MRRLEQLEARTAPPRVALRIVRQIIEPNKPWNPAHAECAGEAINREPEETAEAFEARALSQLKGSRVIIRGAECAN